MFDIFNTGSNKCTKKYKKSTVKGLLGSNLKKEIIQSIGYPRKIIRKQPQRKKCSRKYYKNFKKFMLDSINSLI